MGAWLAWIVVGLVLIGAWAGVDSWLVKRYAACKHISRFLGMIKAAFLEQDGRAKP